jgi:hypothetical protein
MVVHICLQDPSFYEDRIANVETRFAIDKTPLL